MSPAVHHNDTITVAATTDHLSEIRDFIRAAISDLGFTEFDENNIVLAVDEACANLIQHAYKNDASKNIRLGVKVDSDSVRVTIVDTSDPFDPGKAELPDMRRYFDERRHHGLGILLMTRVMDSVEYVPASNGSDHNTLILVKQRNPKP